MSFQHKREVVVQGLEEEAEEPTDWPQPASPLAEPADLSAVPN